MDIKNEIEELNHEKAVKNREAMENMLAKNNNPWNYSPAALEAKTAAMAMLSTKTGLYARIPLTCKGENCPYAKACTVLEYDLAPVGEKCVLETSLIEKSLAGYCRDYDLSPESSYTDMTLVKELVNCDVMMERAQALLSQEGIAIEEVYAGSNDANENFYRKEISKPLELYERHSKMRARILSDMMGTRKEKARMKVADEKSFMDILSANIDSDFIEDEVPEEFKDVTYEVNDSDNS
nr:MAG TPA: hypothetical protein [Bacteriophage sp.]